MSDNVIDLFPDESGYVLTDDRVDGVYNKDLAAMKMDGVVYVGQKSIDGIDSPVSMSVSDMNKFCLMWLCIFDPSVIKEDE